MNNRDMFNRAVVLIIVSSAFCGGFTITERHTVNREAQPLLAAVIQTARTVKEIEFTQAIGTKSNPSKADLSRQKKRPKYEQGEFPDATNYGGVPGQSPTTDTKAGTYMCDICVETQDEYCKRLWCWSGAINPVEKLLGGPIKPQVQEKLVDTFESIGKKQKML